MYTDCTDKTETELSWFCKYTDCIEMDFSYLQLNVVSSKTNNCK